MSAEIQSGLANNFKVVVGGGTGSFRTFSVPKIMLMSFHVRLAKFDHVDRFPQPLS
jgi:hypothetical protein